MGRIRRPAPKNEEEKLEREKERKQKAKDRANKYYWEHKEEVSEKGKVYRQENKEEIKARNKLYYVNNKDGIKIKKLEYERKPERRAKQKEYRDKPENKERQNAYNKVYYGDNREKLIKSQQEYVKKNIKKINKRTKAYNENIKIQAFNILGGCECAECGDINLDHLTIDHIDSSGFIDKKKGLYSKNLRRAIVNGKLPPEKISNLRVLCFNHNCSRTRGYLDLTWEEQKPFQRYLAKLWKEALNFFGPCSCGISELKFLTVSHIHNDGAERRKNGEGASKDILVSFRKQGWPESLKENYRLECYNCNCSRGNHKVTSSSQDSSNSEDSA